VSPRGSLRAKRTLSRLERCARCLDRERPCLCELVLPLAVETRVLVLRHRKEVHKPTNTGRLVALALADGEVRTVGGRGEVFDARGLDDPSRRVLLLFPSPDAAPLARDERDPRPVTLVVPDADWRRAQKLCSRERALGGLPRVRLPEGPPSEYRLRRHPDPRYLATFEAIARALGVLHGDAVRERLERALARLVDSRLRARGRVPTEACPHGGSARAEGPPPRPNPTVRCQAPC
jgi:DTW domain-containing protein YfiP